MPIYTFIAGDGETLEELAPMDTRDIRRNGKLYVRGKLPRSFSFTGLTSMPSLTDKMKRGYYSEECSGSFGSTYTKKQIKKTWGI
jgi:hypothetical protein